MNRRDMLKYLLSTPLALTVDYEKLLWTPKLIITVPFLSYSYIIQAEWERLANGKLLKSLFERDDTFYEAILNRPVEIISTREMRIPLIIEPGKK
jgi:hypothetical protein